MTKFSTHRILLSLVIALCGTSLSAQIPKYDFPSFDNLKPHRGLPDPFIMHDGSRVKTLEDWKKQRTYIKDMLLYYQIDYFPTFLEMAGAKVDKKIDGESLMPLLKQTGNLKRTSLFWHMPGYLDKPVPRRRDKIFRTRPVSVIRKGRWKLSLYFEEWVLDGGKAQIAENNSLELYDLENDRGEQKHLAQQNPEVRDALLAELISWHGTTEAPIPTKKNPAYDPAAKKKKKGKGREKIKS